ncbi:MAG: threonine dehydratase [Candidatus Binataceae bacterium]
MNLPRLGQLDDAAGLVASAMRPTPEICWPTLSARCGVEVWVKHENHTPTASFKVRGGLVYVEDLVRGAPAPTGIIAATRGNHGRSIAFAARRRGLRATIVVPHGNSIEQNAAIRAFGAELIEHGRDFQDAFEHASKVARERKLTMIPSFHEALVRGVATYGLEFLRAVSDMDTVYVPIGLGSGICGTIAAREALGLTTRIVGVVAAAAPAYALSFAAHKPVATESAITIADGLAVRVPNPEAVEIIRRFAERVVAVTDQEIEEAMRNYFTDTHNVAEGAGAAALAALLKERDQMRGRRVGVVLSGGNIDRKPYARILADRET